VVPVPHESEHRFSLSSSRFFLSFLCFSRSPPFFSTLILGPYDPFSVAGVPQDVHFQLAAGSRVYLFDVAIFFEDRQGFFVVGPLVSLNGGSLPAPLMNYSLSWALLCPFFFVNTAAASRDSLLPRRLGRSKRWIFLPLFSSA